MAYESIPDYLRKLRSERYENQIEQSHTFSLSKASYPKTSGKIEDFKRKLTVLGRLWDLGTQDYLSTSPFYPFLDIIKNHMEGPIDDLLKRARVSPLHYTLFEGHFSHNEAYREEEILFYAPCINWENVSILEEVVRLLEIVLQGKDPLILLFPNMCDYNYGALKLIEALSARPIAASLWILAYDAPSNPEDSVDLEEKKKHQLEQGFQALMNLDEADHETRLYQIYEAARSLFMFFCFRDAVLLAGLFLKYLSGDLNNSEPILRLDLEFLLGMSLYGINETGQALEHLKRIEDPQKVMVPEKKYFEFYTKQSEIYLFRGSYEMASKAVYQAKKYQREDNTKEEYQVLFLQFSNPQLFNGDEVKRQFSILEKYIQWLWEKGFHLRFLHLSLRPDVLAITLKLYGKVQVEAVIRRSIKQAQKLNHSFFESEGWAALGNLLGFEKDLASSLRYFKKGLRIREEKLGGSFLPQILNGLGYTCMINGDLLKAYNYFQRALNLLFKQKNHMEVVMTLINLGYTSLYGQQFNAALQFFQSAFQLSRQLQTGDIPYHSRREIYLFVSYLYFFKKNYGKSSEFLHLAIHESFDRRPHVISLQNALLCMEVGGTISHLRKKFYLNQFWKLADRDPVQIHFAALSLQLLSLNEKEDLGLDGKGWWIKNQALIKKYKYPALKSYSTMTFSHWAKRGFPLDSPLLKKKSSQLKETLIFREAQQARMVLNLEKRVQEISLINQIHQRILHNKHIEAFLLQVKDLIFRNFVCDQIQVYLDPRHFTPHSLEILTSLEDLEPWIRNIFYQKGDRKKVFILSPHSDLPRKIASFGYFPFLHEGTLFGGIMITDLEATEERLTVDDGDFLSIVADQISAGVALFFQNMQLENRAVELMFAKEQVENSLKDLEKSQFHLIQTEKASAIGQLVAGVAHEINSPLGAVKSMAGNLRQQVKDLLFKSPELGDPLRRNWRSIARDFIKESTMTGLSTREERKLRRQWEGILVGKPNAEDLAEKLVEMGWQPGNQEFKKWGNESRLLEFGYSVSQIKKMVTVIGDAVRRAQKIVFALKSFTQGSDQANSQPVSLPEGINTVLTLYRNRLKAGVELELDWEGHPTVQGVPEELGQVWTNLIQNALQAMDNHGKLKIIIREEEKTTVIIEDSGPGVPPLLRERIFEPFFTTKKEGEGTGLGLHICKQIIERHQGEIWIGQGAEGAKFCVALPRHWETTHE